MKSLLVENEQLFRLFDLKAETEVKSDSGFLLSYRDDGDSGGGDEMEGGSGREEVVGGGSEREVSDLVLSQTKETTFSSLDQKVLFFFIRKINIFLLIISDGNLVKK